mmetsp:Transcript_6871/g.27623  ORF Transcript_6871/g.27623 Transcript_6871/m.27623 type:complete len:221 (-) Transcript_6871:1808-2470(-)
MKCCRAVSLATSAVSSPRRTARVGSIDSTRACSTFSPRLRCARRSLCSTHFRRKRRTNSSGSRRRNSVACIRSSRRAWTTSTVPRRNSPPWPTRSNGTNSTKRSSSSTLPKRRMKSCKNSTSATSSRSRFTARRRSAASSSTISSPVSSPRACAPISRRVESISRNYITSCSTARRRPWRCTCTDADARRARGRRDRFTSRASWTLEQKTSRKTSRWRSA